MNSRLPIRARRPTRLCRWPAWIPRIGLCRVGGSADGDGQASLNFVRQFGVNTDFVLRGGERLGQFYLETGASQRPSVETQYSRTRTHANSSRGRLTGKRCSGRAVVHLSFAARLRP